MIRELDASPRVREVLYAATASNLDAMAALAKGSPEFIAKVGEMKAVSAQVKEREAGLKDTEEKFRQAMLSIPNRFTNPGTRCSAGPACVSCPTTAASARGRTSWCRYPSASAAEL